MPAFNKNKLTGINDLEESSEVLTFLSKSASYAFAGSHFGDKLPISNTDSLINKNINLAKSYQ